jgi:stage II sporulation protein D
MVVASTIGACAPWRRQASPYQRVTTEPQLSVFLHRTGERVSMPLERYLEGVVAGEMEPTWHIEALKAQAILARTFTMEQLQRRGGTRELTGTDVSTDETQFQAYDAERINDAVRRAVAETRGQMLVNARGEPIRGWYHADAGGKTATADEGLAFRDAPTPHIQVVEAPSANAEANWSASFSTAEFLAAVRKAKPNAKVTGVTSVSVARRGPSGRATELSVGGERVPAVALRVALDPRRMRSTMLTSVLVQGGQVVMNGRGFGHGVGLPQWSARYHAERGENAAQILQRYFRGVRVEGWWR